MVCLPPTCLMVTFTSTCYLLSNVQGLAERTPRFGRGIASDGERIQWWGACLRTAVYVPFSVYTMAWLGEHRAFVVEGFIKNGGSLVATQRAFRNRFAPGRRDTVPDKKTIYHWVSNFRQTGSALKQASPGRPRTATGPENVAAVRASILKSPRRSARKHVAALRLSDRSVRRILHRDVRMHRYNIVMAQKLKGSDFENCTKLCRDLLNVRVTDVVFFSDEAHFHLSGTVNKQNF